jgi:hypothetical protein
MTSYRARFENLVRELVACPEIQVTEAKIGPPTPAEEIAAARRVAGAAWPDGMADLYREVGSVDIDWEHRTMQDCMGSIHIPAVRAVWDYRALEGDLWFDWLEPESPLHRIRPIDRFVPEAYAVLYPVPGDCPATVSYHYCGQSLVPTGLDYRQWLDKLFVARGVSYWLGIFSGPRQDVTWVEEAHDAFARLFPDFDPLEPVLPREKIPLVPPPDL